MKTKLTNPEIITCESLPHDEVITTPQSEELKKEWSDEFKTVWNNAQTPNCRTRQKDIINFISFLLAKQQEEFVKMIEDRLKDSQDHYSFLALSGLLADIKSKLK